MTKSLCSLGRVLHAQGLLGEAELLLRRALTIRQQTPGTGAAGIARNLSYLAAVLRDQKKHGAERTHSRRQAAPPQRE